MEPDQPRGRQRANAILADTGAPPPGFKLIRRRADPRLAGLISEITGYRENGQALHLSPETASLVVPLVIGFREPFEIALGRAPSASDRFWSFTSGLFPGFVLINSNGGAECVQINFTPLGAYRFFGMPMSEIAGSMVTLDDLGDQEIAELRERLAVETDWNKRLDMAADFAFTRLSRSAPASAEVSWAYETILRRRGGGRIGEVAGALEWSRKHLNDRFRREVGMGPKAVARVARFNRALALARAGAGSGWAGIAAECGYADQAHLVREFREFTGKSPAALMLGAS